MIQEYLFPETVDEALAALTRRLGRAAIIAGGTDLLLKKESDHEYLVDLGRIAELDGIVEEDGWIVIGANTTHSQCAAHPLIQKHAPVLARASGTVGSTQIRNVGTVAGNIVSANPAADAAVALAALEAEVVIRSRGGSRQAPVTEVYAGIGCSNVDCRAEVITQIKFPARRAGEGSAYERLEQRQGLSLPMVSTAVSLRLSGGRVDKAVIVAAPLAPGPTRVHQAEKFLVGRQADEASFTQAGLLATEHVSFRSSPTRGGAEYRHRVLPVLVCRALTAAAAAAV